MDSIGFTSLSGTSTDGNFAVSGTFAPVANPILSDGHFAITGEIRTVVSADEFGGGELIVNGSFENTKETFVRDGQGLMILRDGSETIPGWKITTGEMAWIDNANVFGAATPFGDLFLDLTGLSGPNAGLTQTIPTLPGRQYKLSLSLGYNSRYSGRNAVAVCTGSASTIFSMIPASVPGDQWQPFELKFTAESSSTAITIEPIATTGGYLGLDNVSLVEDFAPASNLLADLVVNGSFENNCSNSFVPDGQGVMGLAPGSVAIPGWTVTGAELAWGLNGNGFGSRTPFGTLFLDLTGYHDALPYGGITQTLPTVPGEPYRLSFALGTDQSVSAFQGPVSVRVQVGEASESFTFTPAGEGNQWEKFAMNFTATSAVTPLTFTGIASFGGKYIGLDNVSVVAGEASSELLFTSIAVSQGELVLGFATVAGTRYSLESSADLTPGSWQTLEGSERSGTGNSLSISVPIDSLAPHRFFRLRRTP